MYYVYLLVDDEKRRYIGYTADLKKRVTDHNASRSRYTKGKRWRLVYYEAYASKEDAMRRERRLKDGRARRQLMNRVAGSMESLVV